MKIQIHAAISGVFNAHRTAEVPVSDLGFSEEEWKDLSDSEKEKEVCDYAFGTEMIQLGFEEIES